MSLVLAALTAGPAARAQSDTPAAVFGDLGHAQVADGIDAQGFVTIGGIAQWLSVRGRHQDAPILLFLHGGPGLTSIPTSYYFLRQWEEYFTVAQYDQRGAGKTYGANDPDKIRPTMTVAQMVADAEDVAAYLRRTYHRDKIVLVGHSWGSGLGVKLIERHPDWFYAYVGIGQVVDFGKSEAADYQAVLAAARAAGNEEAVAGLEALAPYPDLQHPERNLQNLAKERHWVNVFHGITWHGGNEQYEGVARLSPDVTAKDLDDRNKGLGFSLAALWGEMSSISLSNDTDLRCPVFLFEGRHDLNVNPAVAAEWFARVHAPRKKLVWFEDSAHMVFEEEPGKTLQTLVDDVLPLTKSGARGG
jgi:pimeloyl-ACP methyl ester carboxylesterase